jgi:acyl-CoA synthetase (NDP forming)
MLEASSIAVVGASGRDGTLGERMVTELLRSPSKPQVHPVNPRHSEIQGLRCVASLEQVDGPVDLVLLGVRDEELEPELCKAAAIGAGGALVFGSAFGIASDGVTPLRERLGKIATAAGMELCGAGCMGFVNVSHGLRAIGYIEPDPLPPGPIAFVSHSGSVFSALLRARRGFGWTLVVSSGQELVTPAAAYIEYALSLEETRVVGLLLESLREPGHFRAALAAAADRDVPVIALTVGGSPAGRTMVQAHSGALAGEDGAWEALFDAYGVTRVRDLEEMLDTLELFAAGRRARRHGTGVGVVHDSGAERALLVDLAETAGVPFAHLGASTLASLESLLDPGLCAENPLDLWGRGADTQRLFTDALLAIGSDPSVAALALCVDLVPEFDGDESYPLAVAEAHARLDLPVVVLSNVHAALDEAAACALRAHGVPVLEGTRSGLLALGHLLSLGDGPAVRLSPLPDAVPGRRDRWLARLAGLVEGSLDGTESFALLRDYGIKSPSFVSVADRSDIVDVMHELSFPVVLKADRAHKTDAGGVVLGIADDAALLTAYEEMAGRLGPDAIVAETAPEGVEIAVGIVSDPGLGPLIVVGAGGILVELLADRVVALPPLDEARAHSLIERLRVGALLRGQRGQPPADLDALCRAIVAVSTIACELGTELAALDINPLRCGPHGALALDVLVETPSRQPVSTGGAPVR